MIGGSGVTVFPGHNFHRPSSYGHNCELLGDGTYAITWWVHDGGREHWYQVDAVEAKHFCRQWFIRFPE
jgi:hypothetical protein